VTLLALSLSHVSAGADVIEANLEMVARSDLGAPASFGDVTVVGTVAMVATTAPGCVGAVKVVDVKDPAKPHVVASLGLPAGSTAGDLDSLTVDAPAFAGDLLAVALAPCAGGPSSAVAYYDVTDPAAPRAVGETAGATSVSLAQRGDGRVLAARATAAGVEVDDLTDPARPAVLGRWRAAGAGGGPCAAAQLYDSGDAAVAVLAGGWAYDLDLTDPANPAAADPAEGAGGPVAVLPLGNRTIAVVAEDAVCGAPAGERGLRVLTLRRGMAPAEGAPVRYPGEHSPGRLVTSGALAYVAWHGAGLRVVDFGEVQARVVAQFAPTRADVVGVGLLSEHVVVTDSATGLYVLKRPDEGGSRATFWSQFFSLLPYLGFAGMLAAAFLVPRMVASRAAARSGSRVPTPVPVPRRRA
jgi:hypothetical protein